MLLYQLTECWKLRKITFLIQLPGETQDFTLPSLVLNVTHFVSNKKPRSTSGYIKIDTLPFLVPPSTPMISGTSLGVDIKAYSVEIRIKPFFNPTSNVLILIFSNNVPHSCLP